MQQHRGQLDEEKEEFRSQMEYQLYSVERERDRALSDIKKMAHHASYEINKRDTDIECLQLELHKSQGLQAEKDGTIQQLRSDLAGAEGRLRELESEIEQARESGTKMFDSLLITMKNLEEAQSEVKSASMAEETSKKALDDLALALKEVKEELRVAREELEQSRGDVKSNEERLRREAEEYKEMAERLSIEAEEKEAGLVECLRIAGEERASALQQADEAEKMSKEENGKLRDILKQALSESKAAKEAAAEIARAGKNDTRESESESSSMVEESRAPAPAPPRTSDVVVNNMNIKSKRKLGLIRRFGDLLLLNRKAHITPPLAF